MGNLNGPMGLHIEETTIKDLDRDTENSSITKIQAYLKESGKKEF